MPGWGSTSWGLGGPCPGPVVWRPGGLDMALRGTPGPTVEGDPSSVPFGMGRGMLDMAEEEDDAQGGSRVLHFL